MLFFVSKDINRIKYTQKKSRPIILDVHFPYLMDLHLAPTGRNYHKKLIFNGFSVGYPMAKAAKTNIPATVSNPTQIGRLTCCTSTGRVYFPKRTNNIYTKSAISEPIIPPTNTSPG